VCFGEKIFSSGKTLGENFGTPVGNHETSALNLINSSLEII
jgi:hypothetical protein